MALVDFQLSFTLGENASKKYTTSHQDAVCRVRASLQSDCETSDLQAIPCAIDGHAVLLSPYDLTKIAEGIASCQAFPLGENELVLARFYTRACGVPLPAPPVSSLKPFAQSSCTARMGFQRHSRATVSPVSSINGLLSDCPSAGLRLQEIPPLTAG